MNQPHIRLLDLLAGWASYADEIGEEYADTVADLYQEAGSKESMSDNQIYRFLIDRVMTVLCK